MCRVVMWFSSSDHDRPTPHPRMEPPEPDKVGGSMKKALAVAVVFGFLLVDFLFFHDVFKTGEVVTFPQYLTGLLSIPVMIACVQILLTGAGQARDVR